MKRDFDRIRQILLDWEKSNEKRHNVHSRKYSDNDRHQVDLMQQAGLIEKSPTRIASGAIDQNYGLARWVVEEFSITWAGYDYLDAVRDQSVWEKTKLAVRDTGGNATLEIVKELAVGFLKTKIETHTGIKL